MDDKTRLHFIKTNVVLPKRNGQVKNLYNKDFEWLIEQAEKVEVLERQLENAVFTDTYFEPAPKKTFKL